MHACLNMDEIIRLVGCELVASKAKATAVVLACCCKNFEDPVLDVLWETQDQLLPLLESLPGDVWTEGGCTVSTRRHSFSHLSPSFGLKVFQNIPDGVGMGSFPEVRSKGPRAHEKWCYSIRPVLGGALGSAALHHQ